jgi:hypothetical protein
VSWALRALAEEGTTYFVLSGFWELFRAAVFIADSPIRNLGELIRLGPLDEDAAAHLVREPMAALGITVDDEVVAGIRPLIAASRRRPGSTSVARTTAGRTNTSGRIPGRRRFAQAGCRPAGCPWRSRWHRGRGPVSDGEGSLYVSDPPNHAVRKVAIATGIVDTVVGTPDPSDIVDSGPLPAHLNRPAGLAFVPGAGLFIGEENDNVILLAGF